jgi:hypothetical protein
VRARWGVFVALLAFGHACTARANGEPRAEARVHYERGLALADERSYAEALVEFEKAYDQSPHYAVLYNIGLCLVALGRPLDAVETFSRYLREGGAEVPEERRTQIQARIAELEARFAELTITADRGGTLVTVDGREIGRTPLERPVRVPAGVHEISATLDGVPVVRRRIELAETERRTIEFAFAPFPIATVAPVLSAPVSSPGPLVMPEQAQPRDMPVASDPWRTAGFVLTGAGIAAGVGGLVHYAWNRGRHEDWKAEQARLTAVPPPLDYHERALENNELADSIERASAVTVGLFVASGALVAGGVTLVVVDPGSGATVAWSGTW